MFSNEKAARWPKLAGIRRFFGEKRATIRHEGTEPPWEAVLPVEMLHAPEVLEKAGLHAPDTMRAGILLNGVGIHLGLSDASFWARKRKVYAVNARARELAPTLRPAPESITHQAVVAAVTSGEACQDAPSIYWGCGRLSEAERLRLEEWIEAHPDDAPARELLIRMTYHEPLAKSASQETPDWDTACTTLLRHTLWFIENRPGLRLLRSDAFWLFEAFEPNRAHCREAWRLALERHPEAPAVLVNAAYFSFPTESEHARELLAKARRIEPDNGEWAYVEESCLHCDDTDVSNIEFTDDAN